MWHITGQTHGGKLAMTTTDIMPAAQTWELAERICQPGTCSVTYDGRRLTPEQWHQIRRARTRILPDRHTR